MMWIDVPKTRRQARFTEKGERKIQDQGFYLLAGRKEQTTPHRDFRLQSDEANSISTCIHTGRYIGLRAYDRNGYQRHYNSTSTRSS
jgi:hypothetical protein